MANDKLFMGSTDVSVERTVSQIDALLVRCGARKTMKEYNTKGEIAAMFFMLEIGGSEMPFELPARVEPIFQIIQKRRSSPWQYTDKDREQAKRVAWRQIFRWLEAQLAMIDSDMVKPGEVFAGYLKLKQGESLYERLESQGLKMLPAPERNND